MILTRRDSMLALSAGLMAGCGGGGGAGDEDRSTPLGGSWQTHSLRSRGNGTTYPLSIYLPPGSGTSSGLSPVVYLLDGESRFRTMVDVVEAQRARVIVVAIGNEAQRNRDYVPVNGCTSDGGGQAAFLDFIRLDLSPFVEATFSADPLRRMLLGHSHGGSFVLYALFAQPAGGHHFRAYLASDASIGCMSATVNGWESAYAAAHTALPVRLHLAYAGNTASMAFAATLGARRHAGLSLALQAYNGGHIGMIPQAFTDALAFALA
jgi:enterochelin esterase-like enzyme